MFEHYQELWNKTLQLLSKDFSKDEFEEIFKPVNKVYKVSKNLLYVVAPSQFHKSRIENLYIRHAVRVLNTLTDEQLDVKIVTEEFISEDQTIPVTGVDP